MSKSLATIAQTLATAKASPAKRQAQQVGTKAKVRAATAPTKAKASPALPYAVIRHCIVVGRPGNGGALFAHTMAFLDLAGMLNGGACPVAIARQVIGDTAISYHTNRTGCFEKTEQGLKLTERGFLHFVARGSNVELVPHFAQFMKDGKLNDKIGVKNAAAVAAVKHA